MQILNIFHTGGLTLALTLVWLFLSVIFFLQAYKRHKQEYWQYDNMNNPIKKLSDKTPYSKLPVFWFGVVVTILYIGAMIFVNSDYRGV